MLKLAFIVCALVSVVLTAPQGEPTSTMNYIINMDNVQNPNGSYAWYYETSNGIKAQAEGRLINANTDYGGIEIKGSYSYVDPDGVTRTVTYTADENGFRPEGNPPL